MLLVPTSTSHVQSLSKTTRTCENLVVGPEYLLSDERQPFHTELPDHYDLLSHLLDLSVSQSSSLVPLHSTAGFQSA